MNTNLENYILISSSISYTIKNLKELKKQNENDLFKQELIKLEKICLENNLLDLYCNLLRVNNWNK